MQSSDWKRFAITGAYRPLDTGKRQRPYRISECFTRVENFRRQWHKKNEEGEKKQYLKRREALKESR